MGFWFDVGKALGRRRKPSAETPQAISLTLSVGDAEDDGWVYDSSDDSWTYDTQSEYEKALWTGMSELDRGNYKAAGKSWDRAAQLAETPEQKHGVYKAVARVCYSASPCDDFRPASFLDYAQRDMQLLQCEPSLVALDAGRYVYCFHQYAVWQEKQGDYAAAIAACEAALALGATDWTQKGFEGRLARLQKKQATGVKPKPAAPRPQRDAGATRATKSPTRRSPAGWRADPTDTWIALDFETATPDRVSACALGLAVVQNGEIVSTGAWYIQPPDNRYEAQNTRLHGIGPAQTRHAPTFDQLYPEIEAYLQERRIMAHWADFDISVLRALFGYYEITSPKALYTCSCRLAQKAFPALDNHKLPTVCAHCGIPLDHHDAASDAIASAMVALRCRDAAGVETIQQAVHILGLREQRL